LPVRARALSAAVSVALALGLLISPLASPAPVAAAGEKVAIIVGPVGPLTDNYRSSADRVATAATAAGATVVKVYSPNATWPNVKQAVAGANVIVYFGHGNGSPNPYSGWNEATDRHNGWGLNTTTDNGDADSWTAGTLAYCGEKVLLGQLTSSDDSTRKLYCGGTANDGISPAPGFTMVYAQAHYAPGFGERYVPSTPLTTLAEAQARVRNYSTPILRLGGTFIATAYGDADQIVSRLLTQPTTPFGDIFRAGRGYSPSTLTIASHPDAAGAQYWVQRTVISDFHFGEPDYWYAFAGDPMRTPSGSYHLYRDWFADIWSSAFRDDIVWLAEAGITNGCGDVWFCPTSWVTRAQMASFLARALDLPPSATDYFADDAGSGHEADINRVAAAGITLGCDEARYCPTTVVTRDQMASFLARALELPATEADSFTDDAGSLHEPDINRIAAAGISNGCQPGLYCPTNPVTREQMAAFLHRALGE